MHKIKALVECNNELGENAAWDDRTGCFMWVDINGQKLHTLNIATGHLKIVSFPERLGSFAFCESGKRLLFAMETGFAFYYFETDELEMLKQTGAGYQQLLPGNKDSRLNDGRCDRVGRFVVGGIDGEFKPRGLLYSCEFKNEGELQVNVIDGIEPYVCANSTCFSLDGKTMYFTDSWQQVIHYFPYD